MAPKKEFIAIINDKPGVLEKRKEIRPQHLAAMKPLITAGKVIAGGAQVSTHPPEGQFPDAKGSVIIYAVENLEEAKEYVKNDPYTVNGVWDIETANYIPYISAVREPLN
ncbi:unnamed protein product [Clonostachys rosea]|uniref:YCII-related domain-containing protein n=1 Tax=Bionectria ochroleuca TaxID=29856 RepID=A0ABY6TZ69_BIOOC|nr:unnamed protein product [Clonostachys rosea]